MTELGPEDAKLVTLARGAMGRAEAAGGAAVRDADGRTYAGAPVDLSALQLTAAQPVWRPPYSSADRPMTPGWPPCASCRPTPH
jgi:hypothetical protein